MGYANLRHVWTKQIERHATQYLIKIDHYIGSALLYATVYLTNAIKVFGGAQQVIERRAHMSYVTIIGRWDKVKALERFDRRLYLTQEEIGELARSALSYKYFHYFMTILTQHSL